MEKQNPWKRRKNYAKRFMLPSIDRLSDLPDSVLCHILSFLPTKQSVVTSVLSRRWKHLWTDVPSLDFDFNDYIKDIDSPSASDDDSCPNSSRFSDIVSGVLSSHNPRSVSNFRFSSDEEHIDGHQFVSWITAVASGNLHLLDVSVFKSLCFRSRQILLPECLFASKTLVEMKINGCVSIPRLNSVCFPNLKKLELFDVTYQDNESLPGLISGCLVLEDFTPTRCILDGMSSCYIHSSTLKCLRLKNGGFNRGFTKHKLMINTPCLEVLHLKDGVSHDVSIGTLSLLVEVDIWLNVHNDYRGIDRAEYGDSIYEFLDNLHRVKYLKFSSNDRKFPDSAFCASAGMFDSLTKLDLATDWYFLRRFLLFAKNLEFLVIRTVRKSLKSWREPQCIPKCMLHSLKNVEVHEFEGEEIELEMVRYILYNAKVLMMMEIHCKDTLNLEARYDAFQTISLSRQGSTTCRVAFS